MELRDEMIQEAKKRMELLKLHPNAIKEFMLEERTINSSQGNLGGLYWIDDKLKKYIANWEKETGNIVYHVITNRLEFGLCHSLFYVSTNKEEWDYDIQDLKEGYPLVYVYNETCSEFSEYGSIGYKSVFGGLVRTA